MEEGRSGEELIIILNFRNNLIKNIKKKNKLIYIINTL